MSEIMSILIHIIGIVIVVNIVFVLAMIFFPPTATSYTVFDQVVAAARLSCNPESATFVPTPFAIEQGYSMLQIFNDQDDCRSHLNNIDEDKW